MTPEERQLLNALADRVRNVPGQRKDPEADQFLRQLTQEQPDALYMLAQTVIMQDFALRNAQGQIDNLKRQLDEGSQSERPGSFLGGLFGGGAQAPQPAPSSSGSVPRVNPWGGPGPAQAPQGYAPPEAGYGYNAGPTMQPSQTGDFLRNAASTAAGVAGGALLFQGISSLFSGHHGSLLGSGLSSVTPGQSLSENTVSSHGSDSLINTGAVEHNADGHDRLQEADDDDSDDDSDDSGGGDGGDYA